MALRDLPQADALIQERYRFNRQEYHAMQAAGVFAEGTRVELVAGDIVAMSPINPLHAGTVNRLAAIFYQHLAGRALIAVQNPFTIGEMSEPRPDLAVLRPREDYYARTHPTAADMLLVVEVAEASLRYDREAKAALYAAAGLADYWLVNLVDGTLEAHRDPGAKGYRSLQRLAAGDHLSPLAFPDLTIDVGAILPPADDEH